MTIAALIVAAGKGSRAGAPRPKQYAIAGGRALLAHTIEAVAGHGDLAPVQVVIHGDDRALYDEAISGISGLRAPVNGGETRQQSVLRGLEALAGVMPKSVLIHDGARPYVGRTTVDHVIAGLRDHTGAIAAVPVTDTITRSHGGLIGDTVDRDGLWAAQTPQGFRFDAILDAHRRAAAAGLADFTDDAAVARWAGYDVALVQGAPGNRKITTPEDLAEACRYFGSGRAMIPCVGHGFDVHAFEPGDHVVLCGVRIAHEFGLKGHSDADVGLHALTDALFGAMGDGDIGQHFPPTDEQWRGAGSEIFLAVAGERVAARGGMIAHVDVTLVCEAPRIGPHAPVMRERIASIIGLAQARVSVKATTSEGLGFTGRREGIAAYATATVLLPN